MIEFSDRVLSQLQKKCRYSITSPHMRPHLIRNRIFLVMRHSERFLTMIETLNVQQHTQVFMCSVKIDSLDVWEQR